MELLVFQVTEEYIKQLIATGSLFLWWALIATILIFVVLGAWGVYHFMTPKVSKEIRGAHRKHNTLALIFRDNHVADIVRATVAPMGYLQTVEKVPKRIPILRPAHIPLTTPQAEADQEDLEAKVEKPKAKAEVLTPEQAEEAHSASDIQKRLEKFETLTEQIGGEEVLKPSILGSTFCPMYIVYSGVALAVTPEFLMGLSHEEQVTSGVIRVKGKDLKAQCLLPVIPTKIKEFLPLLIDQTTIDGIAEDSKQEGRLEERQGKNERLILYGAIIIGVLAIAVSILIKFM